MKYTTVLILVINLALVALLGWGLVKAQGRLLRSRIPERYQKLGPEKWVLFMALAAFWIGLVFLVSFLLAETDLRPVAPSDQTKMAIFAFVFFLMAARMFQSYFSLLGISPEGLAWWTPGRGRKSAIEIPWKAVARVDASGLSNRFVIRTEKGSQYSNYFMGGEMPALLDAFDQHLPKDTLTDRAAKSFAKLRARLAAFERRHGKR